jgi:hypothetical protein
MRKLALAVALAAAVVIPGSWNSRPALAGGYHHHWRHHHVWGDGDWEIIRWANGDCKIWHDDNGPPWGTDWVVLAENFRSWDAAWNGLLWFKSRGRCL